MSTIPDYDIILHNNISYTDNNIIILLLSSKSACTLKNKKIHTKSGVFRDHLITNYNNNIS